MSNTGDIYLEELSVAIKSLQVESLLQLNKDSSPITFANNQKTLNYFCSSLDKIFLHGLRAKEQGYWHFVRRFCRKDTINHIQNLKHVLTNIGRGRAWLFVALNESHLEGFLNSFQHNPSIVDEYYLSHAILSTPQLLLLQSLMCGLEHVNFSIEPDVHYLDIPVFPVVITHPAITPPTQSDCTVRSKGKPELSHQNSNLGSAVVINPDALVNAASKGTELAAKALRGVFGNNQLRTREVVLGDEMPEVAYYELPKALQDVACFDSIAEQQGTELTCMGITVKENTICKSCSFDLNRCQCGSSSKKMNQRTHIDSDILIDDGPIRVTRQLSTRKKHSFKHT
uniref:RUN domain-containing protein n=4 Tax=Ciona intestinalis TaxID=7719 RepID=F6WBB7_CIOIN